MIEYILFFLSNIAGTSKQFSQRNIRRFSFIIYLKKLHPSLSFRAFGIKITEETFFFGHRKQAICIFVLKSTKDHFPLSTVETKVQDFYNG